MSSATLNPPYRQLRHPDSVRLLQVWRRPNGQIAGHVKTVRLESADCPIFRTLSYVWGPPSTQNSIDLNGVTFPVLDSVYPVLEAICDGLGRLDRNEWYWVDSICINQADLDERASQVQLMGLLFARSRATLVWLGDGTADSDEAMDFFGTLAERQDELAEAFENHGVRGLPPDLNQPEKWKLVGDVFQLPWWRRVWTMQEFLLARRLAFHYGAKRMSLTKFRRAMYAIYCCSPGTVLKNDYWIAAWNRRRLRQWREKPGCSDRMGLVALMAYTSDYFVTDPKDRIYSLLGITTTVDAVLVGRPDYRREVSVETVYTNLVESFIRTYQSLDIICFATLFSRVHFSQSDDEGLPSWVPDWRIRTPGFVVPLMISQSGQRHIGNFHPVVGRDKLVPTTVYRANGARLAEYSISQDGTRLACQGIVVDYVDGLGRVDASGRSDAGGLVDEFVQSTSEENTKRSGPSDPSLFDAIIRCMVLDRQDRYLSFPAPLDEFRDEFFQLMRARPEDLKADVYKSFVRWLDANKDLHIRGLPFGDIYRSVPLEVSGPAIDMENPFEEGMAYRTHDTTNAQRMGKRLMVTDQGFVGMAPTQARKGDIVCVLYGCSVPVLLRAEGGEFCFVGECYLDGFMNGEVFDQELETQALVLV